MTRSIVRRSFAIVASTGVGAALALIPSGSALANVQGQYALSGNADSSVVGSGGNTCDLTSGDDSPSSSPVAFTHGTKHRSIDLNATFTNSLNSSDKVKVKGHADSALTLKKKGSDLNVFDMTIGGSVKISHTVTGSGCSGSGQLIAQTQVDFTEHKKGTFTLTRDTKKPNSFSEFVLFDLKRQKVVTLDVFEGDHSHASSRAVIKPGKYEIAMTELGILSNNSSFLKTQALSRRVAQTIHLHGEFTPKKH
jgi:hypothetical protein